MLALLFLGPGKASMTLSLLKRRHPGGKRTLHDTSFFPKERWSIIADVWGISGASALEAHQGG